MANRGGARINSGRKPAPYKTITITFRIPIELNHQISQLIKKTITEWKHKTNLEKKEY